MITEGDASLDLSMISGESLPVYKKTGDEVLAGSIQSGSASAFIMQATKTISSSKASQIVRMVRDAQNSKAPISRIADTVSAYFVPGVIILALIAGGIWSYARGFSFGLEVFVTVLVVSCPCALGLATPIAILLGSSKALEHGVLFKDAKAMENAQKVDYAIFDKTGTITHYDLEISNIKTFGISEEKALSIAAALEGQSEHLIARAVLKKAKDKSAKKLEVSDLANKIGLGVIGRIDGALYKLGKLEFLDVKDTDDISVDKSAIFLARSDLTTQTKEKETEKGKNEKKNEGREGGGDELLAIFELENKIKDYAKETIELLQRNGVKTMILSGDNDGVVRALGRQVGVDVAIGDLLPEQKLERIKTLKQQNKVMMVGDGLNDAPALALSDISIAMNAGNDLSKERANIVLLNNDISGVADAFKISKAIVSNIKSSLFFAFVYNVIAILFAAGVFYKLDLFINPMIAAIAMSLSSLSVVLNAQRLRFTNKEKHGNKF